MLVSNFLRVDDMFVLVRAFDLTSAKLPVEVAQKTQLI